MQFLQLVCLGASWNVPASHATQSVSPSTAATVPGLHSLGATLPVLHACPAVQLVHCEALARLAASLKVPLRHGSAALAPSGQKEPLLHGLQPTWPAAS